MKKSLKYFVGIVLAIAAFSSCDKDSIIDPSLVNVEIELSCIGEEHSIGSSYTYHTILCTGKIGGFTGEANISISPGYYIGKEVTVAGESTSFSFTFTNDWLESETNKPKTFDIRITGPKSQELFESSVVIFL